MRITFILPFVHPGGGVRVVFEYARRLEERGHAVRIIYPGPAGVVKAYKEPERTLRVVKYAFDTFAGKNEYTWFGHPLHITRVPDLSARHIPDADIVIATSNESADWVAKYPTRCGKGAYFIQDYETWNRDADKVDATWKYPLARITISQWLYDLGVKKFGVSMLGPVPNGINTELFYADPNVVPSKRPNDIVMIYRAAAQKGCTRGLGILTALKAENPSLTCTFFGRDDAPAELLALGTFVHDPSQEQIRKMYSSARIFFLPSFQEGFSLTPMEATACGCTIVSTAVGGPMDIFNETSAYLSPAEDDALLKEELRRAISSPADCDSRAANAQTALKSYTWEHATDMLEEILEKLLRNA